jgi:autotransporter-associated beta strand protein
MRKTIFKGLTGLLLPFAAYAAAPAGYGAYQRRQPVSAVSHQTLSDAVRPYAWPAASAPRVLDENELAIASGTPAKELVIIDAAVPDKHILYRAAKPGLEIVEIAATEPGLSQLTDILARYKNLSALHIVSHAADGELLLGNSRITAEDIKQEVGAFSALNGALREGGDLLLYGCDLAAGDAGSELLGIIQSNTHLDVAASSNKTGSRDLKGDWELEISTGDIEAELPFSDKALKDFSAVLAAPNGTYGFQTGWTGGGTSTLTSTHFLVSARDSNTSDPANVDIYNAPPYPAYIKNGIDSANNYFYVRADGVNTGSFELTALTSGEYATGQFTNVRIVGIKLDNTQVTSSTINGNSGSSEENFNFGAGQLASFSGVQIKAFKLYFDTTSAVPSTVPFFEFRTFTIANAQNPNSPPAIANLNGDSVAWAGVGNTVSLDAGGNATVSDVDLDALNGGNGNYSGASLTVQRNGGAVTSDTFGFNTSGALFTVSGSNLQSGGQTFATFTNSNGVLTISFTSSGTTATTALVNDVLRRITYRNDTPAGDATVRFTLSDGTASTTADVTVTTDNIYITNTTDTATIDRTNGVSFSEAIAIAAADGTGTQTLIFASTLAGQTVSATSATSLSESLTLDMDSASGMTLSGGTLSLGGGVTLTLTNGSSDTVSIGTVFAGTGTLSKTGAGTVTLTGSQTYSGTTTISGGTLSVAGDGNLGGGQVVLNGATLAVTGSTTIDNAIALSGAGTIDNGSNITLSGLLSGSNTLTKTGSGTLTLTNTGNSGSYSGGITVSAGRLAGAADSVFTSGALTLNGGSLNNNNTAFTLDNPIVVGAGGGNVFVANAGFTLSGVISGSGALTKTGGQNLTLSGNNTFSGGLAVSGASGLTIANGSNLGSGTVTLNSGIFTITGSGITISNNISMSGDATISNANAVTLSGVISNTGAITKTGAGTLTLSGTNTNTGALSLSAGALTITGTVAGAITAESGTTLQGTGSISGLVTVNSGGTLQIGGSPGTMSLGGGLTLNSGGTLIARINGTTAGTQYDQYNVTGAVTLGGTLSTTGTYTPVIPNSFVIINNDGSDAISGTFNGLAEGGAVTVNAASMRITYLGNTGNDAVLIFPTPVVTDANISISGATGIGGAYKIGDTVTATWNNTVRRRRSGGGHGKQRHLDRDVYDRCGLHRLDQPQCQRDRDQCQRSDHHGRHHQRDGGQYRAHSDRRPHQHFRRFGHWRCVQDRRHRDRGLEQYGGRRQQQRYDQRRDRQFHRFRRRRGGGGEQQQRHLDGNLYYCFRRDRCDQSQCQRHGDR